MKKIILTTSAIVFVGMTSYFSVVFGYYLGGPQYHAKYIPTDSYYTVAVLKELRKGNTEEAVNLLEGNLDSQIITHATFQEDIAKLFDWSEYYLGKVDSSSETIMKKVAEYRGEHASAEIHPDITKLINEHLEKYLQ